MDVLISNLRFISRIVANSAKGALLGGVATSIVLGALASAPYAILKKIVDASVAWAAQNGSANGPFTDVVLFGAYMVVVAAVSALSAVYSTRLAHELNDDVAVLLCEQAAGLPLEAYDDSRIHGIIHRAYEEGMQKPVALVNGLISGVAAITAYFSVMILVVSVRPMIAVVVVLSSVPMLVASMRYNTKQYALNGELVEDSLRAGHLGRVLSAREYAAEMRLFGSAKYFIAAFRELKGGVRRKVLRLTAGRARVALFARAVGACGLTISIAIVVSDAYCGRITAGSLAMLIMAIQRLQNATTGLYSELSALHANLLHTTNMRILLGLPGFVWVTSASHDPLTPAG